MSWQYSINELLKKKYKRVILTEDHAKRWISKQYKKLCKVRSISSHMWLDITEHNFPYCQFFSDGKFNEVFDGLSGEEFKEKYSFELFFEIVSQDFLETQVPFDCKWRPIEKLTETEEEEKELTSYLYKLAVENNNSKFDHPSTKVSLESNPEIKLNKDLRKNYGN